LKAAVHSRTVALAGKIRCTPRLRFVSPSAPVDGIAASLLVQIRPRLNDGCDIAEAAKLAKSSDVAIVMIGDTDTEGSDQPIAPSAHQNDLVEAVAAANPRTIVVVKSGSAVLMPWIDKVPAVLEAWYPGQEDGNAVADVLFGKIDPSGKLPMTFPMSADQTLAADPSRYPGNGCITSRASVSVIAVIRRITSNRYFLLASVFHIQHSLSPV